MIQILKTLLSLFLGNLMRFLLGFECFRKKVIYPKFGFTVDESVKKTVDRPILHSEVTVDGKEFNLPVFANQTRINDLVNSRMREDDVLVVTYPKSGTHLSAYIVKLLAEKRTRMLYNNMVMPLYEMVPQAKLDSTPVDTQRFLKTHLPLSLIPPCENSEKKNKIIFCFRDPKDACISYYKFTQQLEILTGPVDVSFDDWVDLWLGGNCDYGDWFEYVKPYWEQRNQPNFLFISYEGILRDPDTVIKNIASFLDYEVDQDEVDQIKEKIKFGNMKKVLVKENPKAAKTVMRNGQIGESKAGFSERQHRLFNEKFRKEMGGVEFDLYSF